MNILALDGGGIKGVFPASFLATVEDSLGESIANYFDLIVGTSTGGIIALGLGLGWSAQEILTFYEELGPKVFRAGRFSRLRQLRFAKYGQEALREALESKFGDKRLGDSAKRLVVPSLNLETGEVHIFKTSHHPRFERDYKERVVDVALATSAAPTYFPTHQGSAGTPLIDGGIWANNPTGLAIVEAIGVLNWQRETLKVLSLGCTTEAFSAARGRRRNVGLAYWVTKVADVFMAAQSFSSLGTAYVLVGHENVYRISPNVPKGNFGLDVVKEIPSLKGLGATEARKALPQLREKFFQMRAEPFEPFHKL
jgi:patatin-like phospholipase/acyl hydrolase